jgi:hypothetical protein
MIIWDKNFIKPQPIKEEPVEAPFSVEENDETVILEIEDEPIKAVETNSWIGKGFGGR